MDLVQDVVARSSIRIQAPFNKHRFNNSLSPQTRLEMARKRIHTLRKYAAELPRIIVLLIGVFVGGIVGVLFAVAAFSAFLSQFLSALRDATLALATVVLAIATISLYRATSVLASSTRFLAEIESKRDRRANLARRIQLGESLVRTVPV